jgi:hypothetical protein
MQCWGVLGNQEARERPDALLYLTFLPFSRVAELTELQPRRVGTAAAPTCSGASPPDVDPLAPQAFLYK